MENRSRGVRKVDGALRKQGDKGRRRRPQIPEAPSRLGPERKLEPSAATGSRENRDKCPDVSFLSPSEDTTPVPCLRESPGGQTGHRVWEQLPQSQV